MEKVNISYKNNSLTKINEGIEKLVKAVAVTLGAGGKNVIIKDVDRPARITKDGVTVASRINLEDPLEDLGAELIKDIAAKTAFIAGDGTTTAIVLASAFFKEGLKNIVAGANSMDIQRGIEKSVDHVISFLKEISKPIKNDIEIKQIATISSNNDQDIGSHILEAIGKVGRDGVIVVEPGKSMNTHVDLIEGMQLDKGYLSPYFANDSASNQTILEDAYILLINKAINNIVDLVPILEKITEKRKPLLIIAHNVEGDALTALVVNKLRGAISCAAIKVPGFGDKKRDILDDIAVMTGGVVVDDNSIIPLSKILIADLGKAKIVRVGKDFTTILKGEGKKDKVELRVAKIKNEMERGDISFYEKEKLQERLARLTSGIAIVKLGARSELQMREMRTRVENALNATHAAIEEGILPGGGVALLRAAKELDSLKLEDDEKIGLKIVKRALEEPIRRIVNNAGEDGSVVIEKVGNHKNINYGFNVKTKKYGDLIKGGIIDPTLVTRTALENASSIVSLLLTAECAIIGMEDEKDLVQQMPPNMPEMQGPPNMPF